MDERERMVRGETKREKYPRGEKPELFSGPRRPPSVVPVAPPWSFPALPMSSPSLFVREDRKMGHALDHRSAPSVVVGPGYNAPHSCSMDGPTLRVPASGSHGSPPSSVKYVTGVGDTPSLGVVVPRSVLALALSPSPSLVLLVVTVGTASSPSGRTLCREGTFPRLPTVPGGAVVHGVEAP